MTQRSLNPALQIPDESLQGSRETGPFLKAAPWLLALFFFVWAFRGVETRNIVYHDAARHAMNGAFVFDMLRHGEFTRPIGYGREYYGRLPALSLPYHPPLFPAIEALFFAVLGVDLWVARLLVALSVAISVLLFYRLVVRTLGSHLVAACSVAAFCFWGESQAVANDVMLEFPSLAFALGAMWFLPLTESRFSFRGALAFSVLASAAVWTKQHAVFLALMPFLLISLQRRWRLLLSGPMWIAMVLLGAAIGGLMMLTLPFQGTGVDQVATPEYAGAVASHNLDFYLQALVMILGWAPTIVLAAVVVFTNLRHDEPGRSGGASLFWAWTIAAAIMLLVLGAYAERYLFYLLPPLAVIVFQALERLSALLLPRAKWALPAAAGVLCVIGGLRTPATFVSGVAQAASVVMTQGAPRVLYCGTLDGNFMFTVRTLDPRLNTTVLRGDKLGDAERSPQGFEAFAKRFGISAVVIEQSTRPQACDALEAAPTASMQLEQRIPLESSISRWRGHLSVYRLSNHDRAPDPEATIQIEVPRIGDDVPAQL